MSPRSERGEKNLNSMVMLPADTLSTVFGCLFKRILVVERVRKWENYLFISSSMQCKFGGLEIGAKCRLKHGEVFYQFFRQIFCGRLNIVTSYLALLICYLINVVSFVIISGILHLFSGKGFQRK